MLGLPAWEKSFFVFLQSFHTDFLNSVMEIFSGSLIWLPLVLLLAWRTYSRFSKRNFYLCVCMLIMLVAVTDSSTSYFFKNLIQRLRPCKMPDIRPYIPDFGQGCGGKWGFFSSHSANAATIVHFMSAFACRRRIEILICWAFVFLIGFSRIYLGAHFPLDVLVGWSWGLFLAMLWKQLARLTLMEQASS